MGNPRWVRERARCEPLGLLNALHKKLLRDSRRINKLPERVRRYCECEVECQGEGESAEIKVEAKSTNPNFRNSMGVVWIKQATDRVTVTVYGVPQDTFSIQMRWYRDESRCQLLTAENEEADLADLNSISQRILEQLCFSPRDGDR